MARLSATRSASNGHIALPTSPTEDGSPLKREDTNESIESSTDTDDAQSDRYPCPYDPTLLPGNSRDLSFIGIQAFALGSVLSASILLTCYALHEGRAWWRLPAFFICLSVFHFLEYWTTARYNLPSVRASSFLLFNNGRAYTLAHTMATIEIVISIFLPSYQASLVHSYTIATGAVLVLVGQVVRSIAMKQAGTNFNHQIATKHKDSHVLVTSGLYSHFRHPSYFGFFWWALGTQLLVGNKICLVGYAVALWQFFSSRIRGEEVHLTNFFGEKYQDYKKRTGTKIPFVP